MNVTNLVPPTAAYSGVDGEWNIGGWTLFLGGLYIAAWSTYGFETAVCYTRELKDPQDAIPSGRSSIRAFCAACSSS